MDLPGLAVTPVARDGEARFRALMDGHHYLGAPSKIGQTVWYAADDGSGEWPALAAFSAAALKCGARDAWIGWSRRERFGRLHLIANNVWLLLRGRRPNLGSRFLALCARRISADWRARYHHPLPLLETFVDPDRFHGTVYRAANWTPVGETGGYRRRRDGYVAGSTPKRVPLLPLDRNARSLLRAPGLATEHHLHGAERMRKMNVAEAAGILACLKGTVDDPREASGRRHRIESLLALRIAATLCGATGWQSIHEWIQSLSPAMLDRFRCRRIDGAHQRPSVYCIRNIMIKVDPGQLARAPARFCRERGWDQGAGIAVDGKTVRGAVDGEGRQTHVPGASTHGASAPLAQKTVLTAADALPARTGISACPHARGTRFMLLAKGNRKNPLGEIRGHVASRSPGPADFATRPSRPEHGRTGRRGIRVSTDPVTGIPFPWAGRVFMIRRTVREYRRARNGKPATLGKPSAGTVYGVTGHTPETAGAEALPALSRGHWSCGRVHRILDDAATWNEDRCRVGGGHGPENPAACEDWRSASSSGAAGRSRRRSGT